MQYDGEAKHQTRYEQPTGIGTEAFYRPSNSMKIYSAIQDRPFISRVVRHVCDRYVNTISYAGDVVLLVPHVDALQMMLDICEAKAVVLHTEY